MQRMCCCRWLPQLVGPASNRAAMTRALPAGAFASQRAFEEVQEWLSSRATPTDAAQYEAFAALLQGTAPTAAAGQPPAPRPAAVPHPRQAAGAAGRGPLTPQHPGWSHTATVARHAQGPQGMTAHGSQTTAAPAAAAAATARAAPRTVRIPALELPPAAAEPLPGGAIPTARIAMAGLSHAMSVRVSARLGAVLPESPRRGVTGPLNLTTSHAEHGLKDLYPDLYAATLPAARPRQAPGGSRNFRSEWGEALRQGAGEAWAPYLASSYETCNATVHPPVRWAVWRV